MNNGVLRRVATGVAALVLFSTTAVLVPATPVAAAAGHTVGFTAAPPTTAQVGDSVSASFAIANDANHDLTVDNADSVVFAGMSGFQGPVNTVPPTIAAGDTVSLSLTAPMSAAPGATATFSISVRAKPTGSPDTDYETLTINAQVVSTEAVTAQLSAGKTPLHYSDPATTVVGGDQVRYSLTLTNASDSAADLSGYSLPLPAGMTEVSPAAPPATLAPNSAETVTLVGRVDDANADGAQLAFAPSASYAMPAVGLATRSVAVSPASVASTVKAPVLVTQSHAIDHVDGTGDFRKGEPVVVTAVFNNTGSHFAYNVLSTFQLAGLVLGSSPSAIKINGANCTSDCGGYGLSSATAHLGTMSPTYPVTVTLLAYVQDAAQISSTTGGGGDNGAIAGDTEQGSVAASDLKIASVSTANDKAAGTVSAAFDVSNLGPAGDVAARIVFTDEPSTTRSFTGCDTVSANTCTINDVDNGATKQFTATWTVAPQSTTTYTPAATVTSPTHHDGTAANNAATAAVQAYVNQAPVADAGYEYYVQEGGDLVLGGSAHDPDGDALAYWWDLDGDTIYDDASSPTPLLAWSELEALGLGDGNGDRIIRLRVSDGQWVNQAQALLTVTNVAPETSILSTSGPVDEGQKSSILVVGNDPSSADDATLTCKVAWGDGSSDTVVPNCATPQTVEHQYGPGAYTATVTAEDDDGGADLTPATADLSVNRPPAAHAGGPYTVTEGEDLALDALGSTDPDGDPLTFDWDLDGDLAFDDAAGAEPVVPWGALASLGLGDGPASKTVGVSARDGAVAESADAVVTLLNAAPKTAIVSASSSVLNVEAATVRVRGDDPSAADEAAGLSCKVEWGDGLTSTVPCTEAATASHAYALPGVYTVKAAASDKDGGVDASPAMTTITVKRPPLDAASGYWLAGRDGGVFAFGGAPFLGSMGGVKLNSPIVGMGSTPAGDGYWLVGGDGGVFAFGKAGFLGSMGGKPLKAPIVALVPTATGKGYWLAARDGGVFAFGDAGYFGSLGGLVLNGPVVDMVAAPGGDGYWLVGADGGVFAFGPGAPFLGSLGGLKLPKPVSALAGTSAGDGYWMFTQDGRVFAFGAAVGRGAPAGLAGPVVDAAATTTGLGYWVGSADGGVAAVGNAGDHGSVAGTPLNAPVVAMSPRRHP